MENVLSVSEAVLQINEVLTNNFFDILITGEIFECKERNGHIYLIIKDDNSSLSVAVFKNVLYKVSFSLDVGKSIIVKGRFSLYGPTGKISFIANNVFLNGEGLINKSFIALYEKLKKEGIFNKVKHQICHFPRTVAIVTSSQGAAVKDLLTRLDTRFPVNKIIINVLVQGEQAPRSIIEGLNKALKYKPDVIIIGRGGGSKEDLNVFNDELLVRTIYDIDIPIISAIGHQIDNSLVDLVSDKVAITPTEAADIATPYTLDEIMTFIASVKTALNSGLTKKINENERYLNLLQDRAVLKKKSTIMSLKQTKLDFVAQRLDIAKANFVYKINNKQELVNNYRRLLSSSIQDKLKTNINIVGNFSSILNSFDPFKVMVRGYGVIDKDGRNIKSINEIANNDIINVTLKDGKIKTKVIGKENR